MPRYYKNADAPTTPEQGDTQFDPTNNEIELFNGNTWGPPNFPGGLTINGAGTVDGVLTADDLRPAAGFASTNAATPGWYIPGEAGTPTGAVASLGKRVALYYDTTNNQLCFRHGGSWYATATLSLL